MKFDITKGSILGIASSPDVFTRGERHYREGKLLVIDVLDDDQTVVVKVEGNYKHYEITYDFDGDGKLKSYRCNCESQSIWTGACKHVITGLFGLMEGKFQESVSSQMFAAVKNLNKTMEKHVFEEIDANLPELTDDGIGKLRLVPCLHIQKSEYAYVDFTIGESKLYLLKSIFDFASHFKNSETISYGSKLSVYHNISAFEPDSQSVVQFILKEHIIFSDIYQSVLKNFSYITNSRDYARMLALTSRNTDEFFDAILEGRSSCTLDVKLEIQGEPALAPYTVYDNTLPPVSFTLDAEHGKIALTGQKLPFYEITGKKYKYIIANNNIYRMEITAGQTVSALLSAFTPLQQPVLTFTGNELTRFLTFVYPKLVENQLISEVTGEVSVVKQKPLKPRLYFDAHNNDVICLMVFDYGDVRFSAVNKSGSSFLYFSDKLKECCFDDETGVLSLHRNVSEEYRIKRRIEVYGFKPDERNGIYVLHSDGLVFAFLKRFHSGELAHAMKDAELYASDNLKKRINKLRSASLGIKLKGSLLEISVDSDFSLLELLEALESYKSKKRFHRLKDGRFIDLEDTGIRETAELILDLDIMKRDITQNKIVLPKHRALYINALTQNAQKVNIDNGFKRLTADFASGTKREFSIPKQMNSILREYQKVGYGWLKTLSHYEFGGILADDMGLGKTLQIITLLLSDKRSKSLVVCPTSLLYNWENEISRFAPEMTTIVLSGTPERRKELLKTDARVYITTYDMLKRDIENYEDIQYDYLIADEAQYIKNPMTQNAKALKSIQSTKRFALTGTPIENSLTELWSIFDFIMPGYLHNIHRFTKQYEIPIIKNNDTYQASRLHKQISPFLLRRVKTEVLTELPEKTETDLYAELLPEQKRIYTAQLLRAQGHFEELSADISQNRFKILSYLTKLRQICCHPSLCLENYNDGSGKLDLALETIQMALESRHRMLIFSQFTSMLSILKNTLDAANISYFYLDGSTPSSDRMEMCKRFNDGEKDIFMISLKAGGTGLNLTGADVVIHYDPWWNPAVMNQATDRAHRFGQNKAVQVFNLVAKDTIEEKILNLHQKKKDLINSVLSDENQFISALSLDELRTLFAL